MREIIVDSSIQTGELPAYLGCIQCSVKVEPSSPALLERIDSVCAELAQKMCIEQIREREHIAATRVFCKRLGKDVQRYRNSAEAMHRRVIQGKGLYRINNVVDVNNLVSVMSGYSLGTYDLSKVKGRIRWTVSEQGAHYEGIGKDAVNIEFLPVLCDDLGYFGNPNSDSTRAMIGESCKEILMCVYGFGKREDLDSVLQQAKSALQSYCGAEQLEIKVIE